MQHPILNNTSYPILDLDYSGLGFRCGLEVHHQIQTDRKLFCNCPTGLYSTKVDAEVLRHMRPTLSELGEYDPCALMEFKTKKEIVYLLNKESVCTYEMDDTPPFPMDQNAVDIALEIAMLFKCQIVGEAHISRKQYLDGSIPTGFQRTTIVGINGQIPYQDRMIHIRQLGLEEDSCREVSDNRHTIQFRTDRLGMPLIEVVTESEMHHPFEVADVGWIIAQTLRTTGKVRRGLGSVRQDVNVSIKGGTRVEIKGVPRIPLFPRLVSVEAFRQKRLLEIRDVLKQRGVTSSNLLFSTTEMLSDKIHFRTGKLAKAHEIGIRIVAVRIQGIAGILSQEIQPGRTFAHEISGRVRVIACLDDMPNIFHTDSENGDFSLFPEEQMTVKAITEARENDVVILLWGNHDDVTTAINETIARIREATLGIPSETRQHRKGGWTDFERLLAGPNRMYPDTDSPPTVISSTRVQQIRETLPTTPWEMLLRLLDHGLSSELAGQLVMSPYFNLYWNIQQDGIVPPNRLARVLVQTTRAARRKGGKPERITEEAWRRLFEHIRKGELYWESLPILIYHRSRRPGAEWLSIATKQHLLPLEEHEWKAMVDSIAMITPRSKTKEGRIRWLMGQLQRPPGRIPAHEAIAMLTRIVDSSLGQ